MSGTRRVFLAGFMGAGKSAVGEALARKLGWEFVDLDDVISRRAGRSIAEIFADGEGSFRTAERRELEAVTGRDNLVVALGGGALTWEDSLDLVRAHGMLVYLRADVDSLLRRLGEDAGERPLLGRRGGTQLRTHIQQMLEARRTEYEAADITVDASDAHTVEAIAEGIVDALRSRPSADTG